MKTIVLIPAYNAEKEIFDVFRSLETVHKEYDEIIILDDYSLDNTIISIKQIIKDWRFKPKIFFYRHKKNAGYGGAQKNLFKHFLERKGDIAVLIHSDNQYPPERLKTLVGLIKNEGADIVLASRFYRNLNYHSQMPIYKIIGNRFLTFLENRVYRSKLSEFHTGLRAYSRKFLENIELNKYSNHWIFDSQILFTALKNKNKIAEIPVYANYEGSPSHVNSLDYGLKILILTLKIYFKKLLNRKR